MFIKSYKEEFQVGDFIITVIYAGNGHHHVWKVEISKDFGWINTIGYFQTKKEAIAEAKRLLQKGREYIPNVYLEKIYLEKNAERKKALQNLFGTKANAVITATETIFGF